jgi:hypothetical protein
MKIRVLDAEIFADNINHAKSNNFYDGWIDHW